jgi:hypothetical protein
MIIEMTRIEYAICESLADDGYKEGEILIELINWFGVETRVVERSLKAQTILEGIAS